MDGVEKHTHRDEEPLTAKEKAAAVQTFLKEFEAFLLTQSGTIDLEALGWKMKIEKTEDFANDVWMLKKMRVFQAISWWLGNIGKSYMNNYNVAYGLGNLQGENGFIHWLEENIAQA